MFTSPFARNAKHGPALLLHTLAIINDQQERRSSSRFTSNTHYELKKFLASLFDMRDLLAWRKERSTKRTTLSEDLKRELGVESVSIHSTWSSAHTQALLRSLLRVIYNNRASINLPWTGLVR